MIYINSSEILMIKGNGLLIISHLDWYSLSKSTLSHSFSLILNKKLLVFSLYICLLYIKSKTFSVFIHRHNTPIDIIYIQFILFWSFLIRINNFAINIIMGKFDYLFCLVSNQFSKPIIFRIEQIVFIII